LSEALHARRKARPQPRRRPHSKPPSTSPHAPLTGSTAVHFGVAAWVATETCGAGCDAKRSTRDRCLTSRGGSLRKPLHRVRVSDSVGSRVARASCSVPTRKHMKAAASARPTRLHCRDDNHAARTSSGGVL
jgi:hypothetical protein